MKHEEMLRYLKDQGLNPVARAETSRLMISGMLIRCQDGDTLLAAMGNDREKDDQIHAVVDAVHWHIQTKGTSGSLHLVFGKRYKKSEMDELLNAVALLVDSLNIPLKIEVAVDFKPCHVEAKEFNGSKKWMSFFEQRNDQKPPPLAMKLSENVDDDSFRWYRNITGNFWSGRVEGLQVCTVSDNSHCGTLDVGQTGRKGDGEPRKVFLKIANHREGNFDESELTEVADIIKLLVESRKYGRLNDVEREHLLESRILRDAEKVVAKKGILEPVCSKYPFQFPTLWSPQGNPRFLDALMRLGNVPWAVELKEPKGSSPGQYYRHAITQAVLYREFIKRCKQLHPWFAQQSLDARQCKAAVAFPKMKTNKKHQMLLQHHKQVGSAFGVEVIEIDTIMQ